MNELQIFELVLPILLPVIIGWLVVRMKLLAAGDAKALTSAYLYVFLPALIVEHLSEQNIAALFDLRFILANLALMSGIYGLIFFVEKSILRRTLATSALAAFAGAKFNAVVVGLPLLLIAIGRQAIVVVVINVVLGYFTILPLTLFLLEVAKSGESKGKTQYSAVIWRSLQHVLVDPMILATLTGLAIAAAKVGMPDWLHVGLTNLGAAAVPVPLVAVGMLISGAALHEDLGEVVWISTARVVASPLLAIGAARMFGLSPAYSIALFLSFGLPTAKMALAVAEKHGEYVRQMAAIVALTTVSMAILYPIFISICEHLWPGVMLRGM